MRCLGRVRAEGRRCKLEASVPFCKFHRKQPVILLFAVLTPLGLLAGLYADFSFILNQSESQDSDPPPPAGPSEERIAVADKGEILVLLAEFDDPDNQWLRRDFNDRLAADIEEIGSPLIRIELLTEAIGSLNKDRAYEVADDFNAFAVIHGEQSSTRTQVTLLTVLPDEFAYTLQIGGDGPAASISSAGDQPVEVSEVDILLAHLFREMADLAAYWHMPEEVQVRVNLRAQHYESLQGLPGDLYFLRAALNAEQSGAYDQALLFYGLAIDANPENAEAYNNRGNIRADLGMPGNIYEEPQQDWLGLAIEDFSTSIQLDGTQGIPYLNRGRVRLFTDSPDGVFEDLEIAAELSPELTERAQYWTGMAFYRAGEPEASIRAFETALTLAIERDATQAEIADIEDRIAMVNNG